MTTDGQSPINKVQARIIALDFWIISNVSFTTATLSLAYVANMNETRIEHWKGWSVCSLGNYVMYRDTQLGLSDWLEVFPLFANVLIDSRAPERPHRGP